MIFGGMAGVGGGGGAQNCEMDHWTTFARALTKPVPCYWAMVLDLEAFGFKQAKNSLLVQFFGPI